MVLHHIPPKSRRQLLKDIYRVLEPGGYFIFKEHDSNDKLDNYLIDIEHSIYELILSDKPNINFLYDYKAWYFSKRKILSEMNDIGFKFRKKHFSPSKKYNYTNKYFCLVTKSEE